MKNQVLVALRGLAAEESLRIRVRGSSMAPTLADGSTVELMPRSFYLPGDVVAFRSPNQSLRVHRLLGYHRDNTGWKLVIKGDNATWIDTPVPVDRVLGRVCGGDCDRSVYNVSLRQRLACVAFFFRKSAAWLWKRLAQQS